MIDPRAKYRTVIKEALDQINSLKQAYPTSYRNEPEWFRLKTKIRMAQHEIERVDKMIKNGVKF